MGRDATAGGNTFVRAARTHYRGKDRLTCSLKAPSTTNSGLPLLRQQIKWSRAVHRTFLPAKPGSRVGYQSTQRAAAGTLETFEDLLSSLTKTSAALMTGAGVEPQLFVPDSLMDAQEAAALLRVASGWSSLVEALGRELVSRFGLNANFEAMLA
ncbi:hypothetical protein WJX77_007751 [Trebouxia sp. C0004]